MTLSPQSWCRVTVPVSSSLYCLCDLSLHSEVRCWMPSCVPPVPGMLHAQCLGVPLNKRATLCIETLAGSNRGGLLVDPSGPTLLVSHALHHPHLLGLTSFLPPSTGAPTSQPDPKCILPSHSNGSPAPEKKLLILLERL